VVGGATEQGWAVVGVLINHLAKRSDGYRI